MKKILNLIIIFILTYTLIFSYSYIKVNAETNYYNNVLDDLSIDSSFDINNYSIKTIAEYKIVNSDDDTSNDFNIAEIIQIAESTTKELYIYVYCPTYKEYVPDIRKINLYDEFVAVFDDEINPIFYDLELVSSQFGFYKYKVLNYEVSSIAIRYYSIIELQRLPNSLIDEISNDFISSYKTINVSQQWKTYYLNNKLVYEMDKLNTVIINITHNGTLFFEGNSKITWYLARQSNNTRSYFICFDALNYKIDEIYDAKLTYFKTPRNFSRTGGYEYLEEHAGSSWHTIATYGEPEKVDISISNLENVNIQTPGIFGKKFNWNRIMTGKDFVSNLTEQGAILYSSKTIEDSQWVFTYHEYDCNISESYGFYNINDYVIDDVKILTLHFRSGQETYNLGVVSDITAPDNIDDGGYNSDDGVKDLFEKLQEMLEKVIAIVGLLILIILISYITPLANIILLPFKLLAKLFTKNKKNKP